MSQTTVNEPVYAVILYIDVFISMKNIKLETYPLETSQRSLMGC